MPAARPARKWVGPRPASEACYELGGRELAALQEKISKDLLRGARKAKKQPPHLLLTLGAPGAGKSTLAPRVAAERAPGEHYVHLDADHLYRYHPGYQNAWDIPSAGGGPPTGAGAVMGYLRCSQIVVQVFERLVLDLALGGYNLVLNCHDTKPLLALKRLGYRTSLLYVRVPVALAQERCRARAIETGKFLSPTLEAQDRDVEEMAKEYAFYAPWYALWADEFLEIQGASAEPAARAVELRHGGPAWADRAAHYAQTVYEEDSRGAAAAEKAGRRRKGGPPPKRRAAAPPPKRGAGPARGTPGGGG